MCGLKPHADVKLDGLDQTPASARQGTRCATASSATSRTAARNRPQTSPASCPAPTCASGDWKLIRFFADNDDGSDRFELYNLKDDVGETKNLAAEKPELVRELNELISGFLATPRP